MLIVIPNDRGYVIQYSEQQKQITNYFKTKDIHNFQEFLKQNVQPVYIKHFESSKQNRYSNKHVNKYNIQFITSILKGFQYDNINLVSTKNINKFIKASYTQGTLKEKQMQIVLNNEVYAQLFQATSGDTTMVDCICILEYVLSDYKDVILPSTPTPDRNSDKIATTSIGYLEQNTNIDQEVTDLLSQTGTGIKLMFAGMARRTAKRMETLTEAQEMFEDAIFNEDFFYSQSDYEKVGLLKLNTEIIKQRMDFLKYISDKVDFEKVQADLHQAKIDAELIEDQDKLLEDKKKMANILKEIIIKGN